MKIVLDTDNVFTYLAKLKYCTNLAKDTSKTLIISAKNFNIAIEFEDGRHLLVKQEILNDCGESRGEFWTAWHIKQLVDRFPKLGEKIGNFLPELLHFDPESSILIVNYLNNYSDLYRYYLQENQFPIEIASAIGQFLATFHSQTFQQPDYQQFLERGLDRADFPDASEPDADRHIDTAMTATDIIYRLNRITPQVFQTMPIECLQFFKLYQRFPSLTRAIADLGAAISPSCAIHNDLKLNNILLDSDWNSTQSQVIRVIDWERASWGDPAFDLGCILGSYLEIWLDGLAISKMLSINESLQLAVTPLELLQPSLFTLVQSYLAGFPTILATRPDFLDRAIQFAGLALIQRIEISIDSHRSFGDRGIMMLQVAKQLLCTPQAAMKTLFDCDFDRLVSC
ncbi:phosphotransferase [Chamaesiphon minutus]|uniref:Phosphotransferase family protein n=1 Tax=Chamaesiphon minutus (strain ATCC 27169 / PCC 6605) TaxID=1173020 RepID=K9UC78_CHAP6|nr:phosphotransferase [Chamaesiphon minutus]AFY91794.1 phosphotransferase family protein [Chamaesiphon minutus PCC 6605]